MKDFLNLVGRCLVRLGTKQTSLAVYLIFVDAMADLRDQFAGFWLCSRNPAGLARGQPYAKTESQAHRMALSLIHAELGRVSAPRQIRSQIRVMVPNAFGTIGVCRVSPLSCHLCGRLRKARANYHHVGGVRGQTGNSGDHDLKLCPPGEDCRHDRGEPHGVGRNFTGAESTEPGRGRQLPVARHSPHHAAEDC